MNSQITGLIKENKTQPIFDFNDCILEKVYVETPVDTDEDGFLDLIAVFIRRPKVPTGVTMPSIYVAAPYMMSCNEDWYIPHDVNVNLCSYTNNKEKNSNNVISNKKPSITKRISSSVGTATLLSRFPDLEVISPVYEYYNCRGYASVFSAGLGTLDSEGITLTGSNEETLAFKAVIDWLNGRCRAFTNKTDNIEVVADWSSGSVAMSGKSYLGTMCTAVAATGVQGLKTIIPEAAISNWYNYYRYNGLVLPALGWQGDDLDILSKYCFSRAKSKDYNKIEALFKQKMHELEIGEDRLTGNYNDFWDERNYLNDVSNITASVLLIHGLNDWNVRTDHCYSLYKKLKTMPTICRMILHQGEHMDVYNLCDSLILQYMHAWLDHFLYDIDNGILDKLPPITVQSNVNQHDWYKGNDSPFIYNYSLKSTSKNTNTFSNYSESENSLLITDSLPKDESWTDPASLTLWEQTLLLPRDKIQPNAIKLLHKIDHDTTISGASSLSFDARINQPSAIFSVMLVDYGTDYRYTTNQDYSETSQPWGKNTSTYKNYTFSKTENVSEYKIITRGWLNAQNKDSIEYKTEIKPSILNSYTIDLIPTNYTLKKGHYLGIVLFGADPTSTIRPTTVTQIKIVDSSILLKLALLL